MNTGAHDGGEFVRSVGSNAAKGIGVIVAAVLVGVALMWLGYADDTVNATADDSGAVSSDDGTGDGETTATDATTTTGDSTTTTTSPTTTTAPPPSTRPQSEVTVLVLNAAENKPGIAGRGSEIVAQAGYDTLKASDAGSDQATAVQYAPGFEADAVAVAQVFGLDESVVEPFSDPLNIRNPDRAEGAEVIVLIGLDNQIDI